MATKRKRKKKKKRRKRRNCTVSTLKRAHEKSRAIKLIKKRRGRKAMLYVDVKCTRKFPAGMKISRGKNHAAPMSNASATFVVRSTRNVNHK